MPFSNSSTDQTTRNTDNKQTGSDQAVNYRDQSRGRGARLKLGKQATLNQVTTTQVTNNVTGYTREDVDDLLSRYNTTGNTAGTPPALPFTEPGTGGGSSMTDPVGASVVDRAADTVKNAPDEAHARTSHNILLGVIGFIVVAVVLVFFARKKKP